MEKAIRRYWLISLLIVFGISCFSVFFKSHQGNMPQISTVTFLSIFIILQALCLWSLYHCAYKKHGTKWLLFTLILGVLGYSLSIYYFTNPSFTAALPGGMPSIMTPLFIFQQVFGIVFFVLSIILYGINVKRKKKLKAGN